MKSTRSAVGHTQHFVPLSCHGSPRPFEPWVLISVVSQQRHPAAGSQALFPHQMLVLIFTSSELVERKQVNGGHIPGPSRERLPVYSQEKKSG